MDLLADNTYCFSSHEFMCIYKRRMRNRTLQTQIHSMKLVLYINGQKKDLMTLDFVQSNHLTKQLLFRNAIEKIKLSNWLNLRQADNWELFVYRKSKMQ